MNFRQIHKSVLTVAGVGALALGGLFAGRLSAGAFHDPETKRADFAPRVFARMARALDLSQAQRTQIKNVLKTHVSEIEAQIQAAAAARGAFQDAAVAQPVNEAAIRARAQEMGNVQSNSAILFARIRTEIDPILTPEQREKIQRLRDRMRYRAESAAKSLEAFLRSDS